MGNRDIINVLATKLLTYNSGIEKISPVPTDRTSENEHVGVKHPDRASVITQDPRLLFQDDNKNGSLGYRNKDYYFRFFTETQFDLNVGTQLTNMALLAQLLPPLSPSGLCDG